MDISQIFTWPPTPAKWRALKEYLISQRIYFGYGTRGSKSSTGIMISSSPGIPANLANLPKLPWKLSLEHDGDDWQWSVSAEKSTIIDGTNGDMIDLAAEEIFDEPTTIDAPKHIALKGTVTPATLEITSWEFTATDDKPKEIVFDDEDSPGQIELNLVIGKITFTDDVPSVEQLATLPQRIVMVFLNGKICKGITSV